jgi:hypothetical protein
MKTSDESNIAFNLACRLTPSEENISARVFLLHEGNLHFEGDRSWFVIDDFVKSNSSYTLSYSHIESIFRISGNIELQNFNDEELIVTNGKNTLTLSISPTTITPREKILPKMYSIPDTILLGYKISSFKDEFSSVVCTSVEDTNVFVLHKQNMVAFTTGDDKFEANLTNDLNVIQSATVAKADIGYDDEKNLYFSIDQPSTKIKSMIKCRKAVIPSRTRDTIKYILAKTKENAPRYKIKYKDMLLIANSVAGMSANNTIDYTISGNNLNVFKRDRINTRLNINIDITNESNVDVKFESLIFESNVLGYLASSVPKPSEVDVVIQLHTVDNKIILYMDTDKQYKSYVCTFMQLQKG